MFRLGEYDLINIYIIIYSVLCKELIGIGVLPQNLTLILLVMSLLVMDNHHI